MPNEEVNDICIEYLKHETKVSDELLDAVANLNTPTTGFTKISFKRWRGMESALNTAVIDRFLQKTTNL